MTPMPNEWSLGLTRCTRGFAVVRLCDSGAVIRQLDGGRLKPCDLAAGDFQLCGHCRLVRHLDPGWTAAKELSRALGRQDDEFKSAYLQRALDHVCTCTLTRLW